MSLPDGVVDFLSKNISQDLLCTKKGMLYVYGQSTFYVLLSYVMACIPEICSRRGLSIGRLYQQASGTHEINKFIRA